MSDYPGYKSVPARTFFLELFKLSDQNYDLPVGYSIEIWDQIEIKTYLENYVEVGNRWGWSKRLLMNDADLLEHFSKESIKIYKFLHHDRFIGFAEVSNDLNECEIIYFGFVSTYLNKGLGSAFMRALLNQLFNSSKRIFLTTCEYDHPAALNFYKKIGFQVYKEKIIQAFYSETFLQDLS